MAKILSRGANVRRFFVLEDEDTEYDKIIKLICRAVDDLHPDVTRLQIVRSRDTAPLPDSRSALGRPLWCPTDKVELTLCELKNGRWSPDLVSASEATNLFGRELEIVPWQTHVNDLPSIFMPHAVILDVITKPAAVGEKKRATYYDTYSAFREANYPSSLVWIFSREATANDLYGIFLPKPQSLVNAATKAEAEESLPHVLGHLLFEAEKRYQNDEARTCITEMLTRLNVRIEVDPSLGLPQAVEKKLKSAWILTDPSAATTAYEFRLAESIDTGPKKFTFYTKQLQRDAQWDYLCYRAFGLPEAFLWEPNREPRRIDKLIVHAWGLIKDELANPLIRVNAAVLLEMLWGTGKSLKQLNAAIPEVKMGTTTFRNIWEDLYNNVARRTKPESGKKSFKDWFSEAVLRPSIIAA